MRVSISDAEGQLVDLMRRAENGEDIVLTHDHRSAVRLVPVQAAPSREQRDKLVEALQAAAAKVPPGPCAARSQDFLYDDDGLPA